MADRLVPPDAVSEWVGWLSGLPEEQRAAGRQRLLERVLEQGAATNPAEAAAVIELILRPPPPTPQRTRPRRRG